MCPLGVVKRQRLSEIIHSGSHISLIKEVGKLGEVENMLKFGLLYLLAPAATLNPYSLTEAWGRCRFWFFIYLQSFWRLESWNSYTSYRI